MDGRTLVIVTVQIHMPRERQLNCQLAEGDDIYLSLLDGRLSSVCYTVCPLSNGWEK